MRTIVALIVLILLTASGNCVWSQQYATNAQAAQNTTDKPVTLILKDTPLPTAMDALFKNTDLSYAFARLTANQDQLESQDYQWWNRVTVSVNITNVPFRDAIRIIARAAGLNIAIRAPESKDTEYKSPPGHNVIGASVPLEDQLKLVDYLFSPSMQSSNQLINRTQAEQMAPNNQIQQNYTQNAMSNSGPIKMAAKEGKGTKLLSVQLEQANVFDVISQLMSIYKKDYILDTGPSAELSGIAPRVTARMSGVTLDEFLSMLKSSSGIQVEEKNGQTIIRWRPEPKSLLTLAPLAKPYTVYYLYLLVDDDSTPGIGNLLSSLEDGPALSGGNIEYVNWLREKHGLESAQILIAGSVSNVNASLLTAATNNASNTPLSSNTMSVRVGPVTMDGMEFKASLYAQISVRSNLENKVHMTLADRLYWRQAGATGDTRSSADRVVLWPIDRTRLVRSERIVLPNGNKRLFVLVASVSPVSSQDMWAFPIDK